MGFAGNSSEPTMGGRGEVGAAAGREAGRRGGAPYAVLISVVSVPTFSQETIGQNLAFPKHFSDTAAHLPPPPFLPPLPVLSLSNHS